MPRVWERENRLEIFACFKNLNLYKNKSLKKKKSKIFVQVKSTCSETLFKFKCNWRIFLFYLGSFLQGVVENMYGFQVLAREKEISYPFGRFYTLSKTKKDPFLPILFPTLSKTWSKSTLSCSVYQTKKVFE